MTIGRRALTRRERLLLLVLGILVVGLGVEAGLRRYYLEPRHVLLREIEEAEALLHRMRQLEARAEEIRHAYQNLTNSAGEKDQSSLSTSGLLLEIEKLARESVRLHSVQPHSGDTDGRPTLHLSIEASSDLVSLGRFLERMIGELGTRVTALTLTADATGTEPGNVRSRIELDVTTDGS